MKRFILTVLVLFVFSSPGWCVDTELQDLTADATPGTDSLVYCVDDPSVNPLSRKCTVGNIFAAGTDLDADGVISANSVALGTDTTGNYALGDAEGGAATTGDSATAFFSSGTLEVARGGTGASSLTDLITWDIIGNAAGTGTISFGGFDQDITSSEDGGDLLTIGTTDADQSSSTIILRLYTNDTNDAETHFIVGTTDEDGTPVNDYTVSAVGTVGAITTKLGVSGVRLTTDGDGALTFLGLGDGSDEDLTLNFDDTSNTVVASSSTGVTSLNIGAISLTTTASLIVADEVYDATDWNGETDVPTKNAVRDKIESITATASGKEYYWPASATLPLEAADSIPPINKDAGTNIDQLVVDFDKDTDECRTVNFKVPATVNSAGTVTLGTDWYTTTGTANSIVMDFRHNSGVAEGVDPDAALTTEAASADAAQGTGGQITVTTWTETMTNLGWAAGDMVDAVFCRDANNASDSLTADSRHRGFWVIIP